MGLLEILGFILIALWVGGLFFGLTGSVLTPLLLAGLFFFSLRFLRTAL